MRTLQLLVEHGVDTPDGFQKLAPGKLTASTVNRHLRRLGYDHGRMTRQPPAVRFQAECANALWHFDMSPSDLKHLKAPAWIDADRQGEPILMLFSVVDDRSGLAYQEYRCVYGEDVETALRFLFNAMSPKPTEAGGEADPFQGIPAALSLDNGPVAKSAVFKRVMESLGVEILPHMPAGSDGRRTTARAKGKVERPFRTVKDAHETLYHFHEPETEAEANRWLARFIATYNRGDHRSEPHARIDDWLAHLPADGVRQMCAWERFCAFAREPERRLVGIDCRLTVAGVAYEVDAELAGETVVVWWGLFDQELWVEHGEARLGPFRPAGGPIPLHRYRKHRKSRHEVRADQVAALAAKLALPRAALSGENAVVMTGIRREIDAAAIPVRPFQDPDPFHELVFANPIAARRAIADASQGAARQTCRMTTGRSSMRCLTRTLARPEIIAAVRDRFPQGRRGGRWPMLTEVMRFYGLARPPVDAGFFETEHHAQVSRDIRAAIMGGRLIALTAVIGSGKTVLSRRLRADLEREGRIIVSRSLSIDKAKISLPLLEAALFYDLTPEKTVKISGQSERRERDLQELFRRAKKPVALFVDDAHDLHPKTLTALKRLIELVAEGGGQLSIVLVGHPKLKNDLRRPKMEEIGDRTTVFEFGGLRDRQRDYIDWVLKASLKEGVAPDDVLTDEAATLLAAKLKTPLQIGQHLVRAFEAGFEIGAKPIAAGVVEAVLSSKLDELEPQLTRNGYDLRSLVEQFDAKPAEIRRLLRGDLDAGRAQELMDEMRAAGLPT